MKRFHAALVFLFAIGLILGCAKKEEAATDVAFSTSTAPAPQSPAAAQSAPPSASASGEALLARAPSGDVVSVAVAAGPRIEIVSGGVSTTLTGETKDTGKHKYYDPSGAQLVEVKPGDSGFKVRTPDGKLLWKVKISDDKIKVSDNEENANAWSVKTGYPDKAKVVDPTEKEVGEVRFANAPSPARVRDAAGTDAWTIEGGTGSGAWGVLLMENVPMNHRAIILAELISRGR